MKININTLLLAISDALDFIEIDLLKNVLNHNKRVAVISNKMGRAMGFSDEDIFDLTSYALMHDKGVAEYQTEARNTGLSVGESSEKHCLIGESDVNLFPFIKKRENIILYHHEYYNGEGYFGKTTKETPLFSQIICLADAAEKHIRFGMPREEVLSTVKNQKGRMFSFEMAEVYEEIQAKAHFWLDINDYFIDSTLKKSVPVFYMDTNFKELSKATKIFSRIIDNKSSFTARHSRGISEKAGIMADYYGFNEEKKYELTIAADLHDIGKLVIPNYIIDKPDKLTEAEIAIVETHTYYTRHILEKITHFENITNWASNHHEKLNGHGYPFGKVNTELDFESRLMTVIDIYQALTEDRPYRASMSHIQAMEIVNKMASNKLLDASIVNDVELVLSGK